MSSKYRHTTEYTKVLPELVLAARYRGTIRYAVLGHLIGIYQSGHHLAAEIGQVLGEISEDAVSAGRSMLSAVAVGVGDARPGKGFFKLARDLGSDAGAAGRESLLA